MVHSTGLKSSIGLVKIGRPDLINEDFGSLAFIARHTQERDK